MGKHRAPEPTVQIAAVQRPDIDPVKKNGRIKAIIVYCQPFYKRYRKSLVAAAGAAVTTLLAVYTDGISQEELIFILIQAGAAAGVWRVPNATNKKVVKK